MISILIKKLGEGSFTDRTDYIEDFDIVQGTTKEASTGSIIVKQFGSRYVPGGEDEIQIFDGATKIFGGYVVRVSKTRTRAGVMAYSCDLKNKVHALDRKLVNKRYTSMTARNIILDIVSLYSGAGITTVNVENDLGAVIDSIYFSNIPPSEAIQNIADIFGKEWYVDPDGDIHFYSKLTELAPFGLDDTTGNYVFDSLHLEDDYTQIKNSILVQAGDELSTSQASDTITVTAGQKSFPLTRRYNSLSVTVNGVAKTVGIANIDTFTTHDFLYDFNAQSLSVDPLGSVVATGNVIVATGYYYFPIAVRYNDSASIAVYGRREATVDDKSIKTRADAISRAQAELAAYANPITTGSFETNTSGLRAGMRIAINSPLRGVNAEFVIQRVNITLETPTLFLYKVELVSIKSFELIDLLAQIIKGRRVEQAEGTVIANAERLTRDIAVTRTWLTYFNSKPTWVTGYYAPTSLADRKRPMFADRGALTT
jgi:hypothetical protein